jgi:hypothetical protein
MRKWKFPQLSANEEATQGFIKFGAYAIVIAVVGYADIAFIQIMSGHWLGGLFGILSMIGAVATAASIIALLFGKAYWFRPGKQLKWAYFFTGAEVLVSLLNVLLSFELTSGGHLDQFMAFWYQFTAATPFVALVGWILILHFDKSQQERHEQLEFEERTARLEREQRREQQLAQMEHEQAVFEAKMQLADTYLQHETAYMQQFVNSPEVQQRLQAGAMKVAMETFSQLTGLPFVAGLPMPQQPPALPQVPQQLQQTQQLNCVAHGTPAVGTYNGQSYCQTCLDNIKNSFSKPSTFSQPWMTAEDLAQRFPLSQPQLDQNQANQSGSNQSQNGHNH